jgi:hypothetical protein
VEGRICSAQETCNSLQVVQDTHAKVDLSSVSNNSATPLPSEFDFAPTLTEAENTTRMRPVFRPKIADSKFFLMNGIHLGMSVFDVEMTQRCIASHHCREVNPVMPSSHAGQLSVNFAIVAYNSGISYWLKRRKSKFWWLPPSAGIVVHGAGVVTGFEHQ